MSAETSLVRMRKRELFRKLGYDPHPGQVAVHRSAAPRRVLACGVRFGKSTCGAMEAIAALLEPRAAALGWLVAPNYGNTDRIFKHVTDALTKRLPHRVRELVPREHRIVVTNLGGGVSELCAKSADNRNSLLGEGLDFLVVDEASKLADDVWERCLSARLVDKHGWSLCLSTPTGANWFYREFRRARRDPMYAAWALPSSANPYLDPAIIAAQRAALPENVFKQEFEAVFLGAEREPCETCGGPSPHARHVVVLRRGETILRCRTCNRIVDRDGRARVRSSPDGREHCTILSAHERPVIAPKLPA